MRIVSPALLATATLLVASPLAGCAEGVAIDEVGIEFHDEQADEVYHLELAPNFTSVMQMPTSGTESLSSLVHSVTSSSYAVDGRLIELGKLEDETIDIAIEDDHWGIAGKDVLMLLLYKDRETRHTYAPVFIHIGSARIGLYRRAVLDPEQRMITAKGYTHSLSRDDDWYAPKRLPGTPDAEFAVFAVPVNSFWAKMDGKTFRSILELSRR
jgi:hypothetical protein